MDKTNLAWIAAALVLGAGGIGGIYAVFSPDDSTAQQARTRNVVAAQGNSSSLPGSLVNRAAVTATASPALSGKAQDGVNINPFGK